MPKTSPKQKLFNGRDHSWMQFNRRVLEEAEDATNPLLERVKFLAITASNLDEYVEIRQAGLMQRIEDGYEERGFDGLRPDESLASLTTEIHSFVAAQYRCAKTASGCWNGMNSQKTSEHLPRTTSSGMSILC
jgi:polyphosphate kinase